MALLLAINQSGDVQYQPMVLGVDLARTIVPPPPLDGA